MVISFHVFTWKGAIDHIGINNASTTFSFWLPKEFQLNHVVFWIVPFSFLEKTGLGLVKLLMHTKKEQAHRIHRKVNDFRWANWCALCRSHARCSISCISYFVSCVLILVHHDFLWAHVPYLFFHQFLHGELSRWWRRYVLSANGTHRSWGQPRVLQTGNHRWLAARCCIVWWLVDVLQSA